MTERTGWRVSRFMKVVFGRSHGRVRSNKSLSYGLWSWVGKWSYSEGLVVGTSELTTE